ncbi:MAG: hypothetical protein AB3N18_00645 [Allomuricauda sp.]
MFKKPKIETDVQGRKIYRKEQMLELIPAAVLFHIKESCRMSGMKWDVVWEDCVLFMDSTTHCSLMYKIGEWPFSGKLLLTFNLSPLYEHSVSYPDKRENMKRFMHHKYRC